jgi:hypothetical protein
MGGSPASNFPILVSGTFSWLATTTYGGFVQNVNGYDVGFYADSTLTTELNWEVELYTASNGNVVYWVNIPSISSTANTTFVIAYGNSAITTDQSNAVGTWNNNFKAVYHLGNGTTLSLNDSTGNYNGTGGGGVASGQIDGCISLDGSTQGFNAGSSISSSPILLNVGVGTVSVWMNSSSYSGGFITYQDGSGHDAFSLIFPSSSGQPIAIHLGSATNINGVFSSYLLNTWYRIDVDWNGTTVDIYVNGSLDVSYTNSSTSSGNAGSDSTAFGFYMYGSGPSTGGYFGGYIDEIRIATTVLGAAWITAEYNNQKTGSTLLSIGSQQTTLSYFSPRWVSV